MGVFKGKLRPERVLATLVVVDLVGIAVGCIWVFFGEGSIDPTATYRWHGAEPVQAVAFSRDGRLAASAGAVGVQMWDVSTGQATVRLSAPGAIHAGHLAFSPDGQLLYVGSTDGTLRVFDVRTGKSVRRIASGATVTAMALTDDGTRIAIARSNGDLRMFDTANDAQLKMLPRTSFVTRTMDFSPDGRRLLYAGDNSEVHVWDLNRRKEAQTLYGSHDTIRSAAFGPRGRRVAYGGDGYRVIVTTVTGDRSQQHEWDFREPVRAVGFTPDGRYVLVTGRIRGSSHGMSLAAGIQMRNLDTGRLEAWFAGGIQTINCMAISPDGKRLLAGTARGLVCTWEIP